MTIYIVCSLTVEHMAKIQMFFFLGTCRPCWASFDDVNMAQYSSGECSRVATHCEAVWLFWECTTSFYYDLFATVKI